MHALSLPFLKSLRSRLLLLFAALAIGPLVTVGLVDHARSRRLIRLDPRATELWLMRWTSDNRSLVLTGTPAGTREGRLMRIPIDPKEAPIVFGRNDEWPVVSPDGKRVAHPVLRTLGTTIWRVDFVAPPAGSPNDAR